jgi:dTDP-4-dehydrorhamnose reductase
MKVVILGAKGMLGRDLGKVFYDLNPYLLDKDELDITSKEGVHKLFSNLAPDVVINAAAYTDVDGCETSRSEAMKVNGDSPGYLAAATKNAGAIFVHYSTDYVFDGKKAEGYKEDDEPSSPLNFYGETKLAGERAVRKAGGDYYIIRTSWLYGINGKNFVETMLRIAGEKGKFRVVNDQHGKPTYTVDLAKATRKLMESKSDFGIYHITNEPATTWYQFAREILKKNKITPCASSEFPRPAKRPQYSILLNTKLAPLRPWQEALGEYLRERN